MSLNELQQTFWQNLKSYFEVADYSYHTRSDHVNGLGGPQWLRHAVRTSSSDAFFRNQEWVEGAQEFLELVSETGSEFQARSADQALVSLSAINDFIATSRGPALRRTVQRFSPDAQGVLPIYLGQATDHQAWFGFLDRFNARFQLTSSELRFLKQFVVENGFNDSQITREDIAEEELGALYRLLHCLDVGLRYSPANNTLLAYLVGLFERFGHELLNSDHHQSLALLDFWFVDEEKTVIISDARIFLDKPGDLLDVIKALELLSERDPQTNHVGIHYRGIKEDVEFLRDFCRLNLGTNKFYRPDSFLHEARLELNLEIVPSQDDPKNLVSFDSARSALSGKTRKDGFYRPRKTTRPELKDLSVAVANTSSKVTRRLGVAPTIKRLGLRRTLRQVANFNGGHRARSARFLPRR